MSMRAPLTRGGYSRGSAAAVADPVPSRPPTPLPKRAPAEQPNRVLRLVRPGELSPRARQRRARLAAAFTITVVAGGLFATVVFHVLLTQNQFRLDNLRTRATEEQARYQRLRLQVAKLESPERIVATAQDRLGMVQPPKVTYLAPVQPATTTPSSASGDHRTGGASASSGGWSTVKPQLSVHP